MLRLAAPAGSRRAGETVGDQQPAEQVNFLLEAPFDDRKDERRPRAIHSDARAEAAVGERMHRLVAAGMLVRSAKRRHLFGRIFARLSTVHSTASNSAAPPNQKL